MYKSPSNEQEYWKIVYSYWDDINHILNIYLPTFSNKWIDGRTLNKSLGEYITTLKDSKNPRLVRAFNAALWNIPDSTPNNEIPAWTQFYDLCVLEYVIYEPLEK